MNEAPSIDDRPLQPGPEFSAAPASHGPVVIIEHSGVTPRIDPTAWIAPTAVVSGDVELGAGSRVLFGAVLTSEGGPVRVGARCVVMENAVLRGVARHPLTLGDRVLVGPRAHLSGCAIGDEAFLATGSSVFNGARIGRRVEVRVNGTVHLRTVLPEAAVVPIGWVAVGDPARILPPDRHEEIWAIQEPLDFPKEVFGVERGAKMMQEIMNRYTDALSGHAADHVVEE